MGGFVKQVIVGCYQFGSETVEIVLREGDGGEFYSCPALGRSPRIKIGADYQDWLEVVRVMTHELLELAMFREKARYQISGDVGNDSGAYVFMFTHAEFSNIVGRTAEVMTVALPAVASAWRKWKKNRRTK